MHYSKETRLRWPGGRARTEQRSHGAYKAEWDEAAESLRESIERLLGADKVRALIVTSNREDDNPYPSDPGVAAYFVCQDVMYALSCDRWAIPEHNIRALALIVDNIRAAARHGAPDVAATLLRGFVAKPPEMPTWRSLLDFPDDVVVTMPMLKQRHREMMLKHHPDRNPGASGEAAAEINAAFDVAMRELQMWR